jgi:hypothetical protein
MGYSNQYKSNSILEFAKTIGLGALICFAFVAPAAAEADVRHGTVIGALYASKYVVVAADGREVDGRNRPVNDRKCKIDRLDDGHFFFAFGRTTFTDLARNILVDAHDGARRVFATSYPMRALSETWGSRMQAQLQKVARVDHRAIASGLPSKSIVQGVFGGTDEQGNLAMAMADVGFSLSVTANIALNHSTRNFKIGEQGTLQLFGIEETGPFVGEFLAERTPRAKSARATLAGDIAQRGLGPIDARALTLKSALEFAIAAAKDPRVGGEVSVLVAERGQPLRWFYQGAGCR